MKKIVLLLFIVVFTRSCILEERGRCPTYLEIDFSQIPEDVDNAILLLRYDDGYTIMDTVQKQDYGNVYEIPIRKGLHHFAVFGNIENMVFRDAFIVPEDEQADRIYTYFNRMSCTGEIHKEAVFPERSYTDLHIKVLTIIDEDYELSVTVECSDIGYDYSGSILQGKFRHTPKPYHHPVEGQSFYGFDSRILRQEKLDFMLLLKGIDGGDETMIAEIPLTSRLKEAGIDLDTADPYDIYITIDCGNMSLTVSVLGWNEVDNVEITI